MDTTPLIVEVEQESEDSVLVTFSDGTVTGYVVEELLLLRPHREDRRPPRGLALAGA